MNATVKLNRYANGIEVLAQIHCGTLHAVTYTNRTQASKRAAKLGADWFVWQSPASRVFYVAAPFRA